MLGRERRLKKRRDRIASLADAEKRRQGRADAGQNGTISGTVISGSGRRVKIYGTLGPACSDQEMLKKMFSEGMDGIRLNLSHTSLEESAGDIENYQKAAAACGVRAELLIDMHGPELRTGRLDAALRLSEGELLEAGSIPMRDEVREALAASEGQEVLLDDGKILLRTERVTDTEAEGAGEVRLRVLRGGILGDCKSIALPGCKIYTPAMTQEDLENIREAKRFGVTAVMQPFVRCREELIKVRKALDEAGGEDIRLLAKIENRDGMDRLGELIPYCDEIVIARGDLGNSMELWELPAAQKQISEACRREGRDFMVVTQMLESMTHRKVPTRAEVSDIFNAILDGAASVMVTGETAEGEYPDLVIRYMSHTVREAEKYLTK